MRSFRSVVCRPVLMLLICSLVIAARANAQSWSGPTFREFSGVNQAGDPNGALFENAIGWTRLDLGWKAVEPAKGEWKPEVLEKWGQTILAFQKRGVHFLPVLDYTANWAAERRARTYDHGETRWEVTPQNDGSFEIRKSQKQKDGSYTVVETQRRDGKGLSKFPPAEIADWENYVRRVVSFLRKPPYNVEYFQIWNETWPASGFWNGSMDDYIARVHFPAARIIHESGGKVVYGGWPDMAGIRSLPEFLDRYNAWDSIDVIDFHYFGTTALDFMRRAADTRGRKDLAIWETEVAFTRDPLYIVNNYPRMLYWALGNNWDRNDKYVIFFFPFWSPDDPKAYGYGRSYMSGKNLSAHGQSLQTLAALLQGPGLKRAEGITTIPQLTASLSEQESSLEAYVVQDRIVVAVHLNRSMYADNDAITLRLPYAPQTISRAERVDLSGRRSDLTDRLTAADGSASLLKVTVKDAEDTTAKTWNESGDHTRTFLITLTRKTAP